MNVEKEDRKIFLVMTTSRIQKTVLLSQTLIPFFSESPSWVNQQEEEKE